MCFACKLDGNFVWSLDVGDLSSLSTAVDDLRRLYKANLNWTSSCIFIMTVSCCCCYLGCCPFSVLLLCNTFICFIFLNFVLYGCCILQNKLLHCCFLYVFCSCICPAGYDGPRCQKTQISFSGDKSYIFLKPLESCETDRLSLDLITTTSDALVLYNGPMSATDASVVSDFIAVELSGGYPQVRINLGDGDLLLPQGGGKNLLKINDGKWHTIEVFHERQVLFLHCSRMCNIECEETVICRLKQYLPTELPTEQQFVR